MYARNFWQPLAAITASALLTITPTHADQDALPNLDNSGSADHSETTMPLGLMTPSAPAIDSIDGTGLHQVSDPGTDSIDGTGMEALGSSDTDSIDGTGRLDSTPADNLAQSGEPLRTIDAERNATLDCADAGVTAADDSCHTDSISSD